MNSHNQKLLEAGRKRRAFYLAKLNNGATIKELARKYKVSYERMRGMIARAKDEV